jgi:hypothetical protein
LRIDFVAVGFCLRGNISLYSLVAQTVGRQGDAESIQHWSDVNRFLSERACDGRQVTACSQQHAGGGERHTTDRALDSDTPQTPANVHLLVHFTE